MISSELRTQVYDIIKSEVLPKIRYEGTDLMNVISSIWNLYQRPATEDNRYRNLGDEIDKHYFLNSDWTADKVFVGKLHVLDDEHNFIRFLEGLLNVYKEYKVDAYLLLKGEIEPLLEKENIHIQEDKDDNHQIKTIRLVVGDVNANRVEDRALKFYVCESIITNVVHFSEQGIDFPDDPNCFVLTFDYGWNDFGLHTRYHLYYIHDGHVNPIEEVKIMKRGEKNTGEVLPSSFYSLDNDFCSLGQNERYYERMRDYFGDKASIYLSELRDAAVFTSIQKSFELDDYFRTSLLRYNSAEQMLRLGIFILNGRDPSYAFGFDYRYYPEYNKPSETKLHFGFYSKCLSYQRTYALIGENGVGKTTLMVDLINDIVMTNKEDKERHFDTLPPLFSCVIAITYSPFDTYPLNSFKDFNSSLIAYEYNGLFKEKNVLLGIDERVDSIKNGIEHIWERRQNINNIWKR